LRKVAVATLVLGASVTGLSSAAEAACRPVFSHTTCSGFGPWQKCQNHNKTVCDAPAARIAPSAGAAVAQQQPKFAVQPGGAGRLIGQDGGSLINRQNTSSSLIGQAGGNLGPRR
jgi:hypothetical protein